MYCANVAGGNAPAEALAMFLRGLGLAERGLDAIEARLLDPAPLT